MENELCQTLLAQWCERLLELQITDMHEEGLYGGILCPACSRVHGRCMDALYPFMHMADTRHDSRFLEGAKLLFDWAERVVSRPDGCYVNDTNSDWRGITVFSVIQLAEAIKYHSHILDAATLRRWTERLAKAADFLCGFGAIYSNNVNYRITNALAMQYCSELLDKPAYARLAQQSAEAARRFISDEGFLFGEGRPSDGHSPRGCRAVDIGYNVEESLPSLALYARITGDSALEQLVARAMSTQLQFMLPDGGWDNSFGTRNFKWTYWGSRTSDGSLLGLLLAAKHNPAFLTAAQRNLELLSRCTQQGLLQGGLHYHLVGERPCVHHTFTHAKVLAGILDHGLTFEGARAPLPCTPQGITHFTDIDSYRVNCGGTLATLTCYDWEYLPGGHASGGNLSMLWHPATGPVLCATMSDYSMKEPNNMQLPRFERHECLSPALMYSHDETLYTTLYDFAATASVVSDCCIEVSGQVADVAHKAPLQPLSHVTRYTFGQAAVEVELSLSRNEGYFICPLVAAAGDEPVTLANNTVTIHKPGAMVTLTVHTGLLELPYGAQRCYNLVAGMQAVKAAILPADGHIRFTIAISVK